MVREDTLTVRKIKHVAPTELLLCFIVHFYWHVASNEAKYFRIIAPEERHISRKILIVGC